MTAVDRAEINRRNSSQSTGHRTRDGRSWSRFNAVKQGCRIRLPILPGADPAVLQHRRDSWVDEFQPADDVELYLVEHAVKASWQFDRAHRAEVAQLMEEIGKEADDRAAVHRPTSSASPSRGGRDRQKVDHSMPLVAVVPVHYSDRMQGPSCPEPRRP
jgi:hypothetical protein